jgi:tRNA modification GTPase
VRDTIAAVATAAGPGGIGIVRMSGPHALEAAGTIFRGRGGRPIADLDPHRLTLGVVVDPRTGEQLDEVLAVRMPQGRSYTGEPTVELHCHGGPAVLDAVLGAALAAGARLAEPGEFTRRAFLSGRIDLTQAEAVADIIAAASEEERRVALRRLHGEMGREVRALAERIASLAALADAAIEFDEDDASASAFPVADLLEAAGIAARLAVQGREGRTAGGGVRVAVAGRANVGKSSLFNKLSRSRRSIVTAEPGTTRDYVEARLMLTGGGSATLIDTAGLREPAGEAEAEGVRRSLDHIREADLVVLVLDGSSPLCEEDLALLASTAARSPLVAVTKGDLPIRLDRKQLAAAAVCLPVHHVSSLSGEGCDALEREIAARCRAAAREAGPMDGLASLRHARSLEAASAYLEAALENVESGPGQIDLAAADLRAALSAIGEITGETAGEEILDGIFSRFCVGK